MNNTHIYILDKGLTIVAELKSLKPLDNNGNVLIYSKELSDFGKCTFRISAYDDILDTVGDIFTPHQYHVRIVRGGYTVWQGAIVDNPHRNKEYLDITAYEYEYYLSKKLVHRTSPDINGTANIYRTFSSGSMSDAVTAIMNETIADYHNSTHILKNMTLGTVQNPNFPPGMTSGFFGQALTGPWAFGDESQAHPGPQLQFDFHSILYVLKAFGIYSYGDFTIDQNLQFTFQSFLGKDHSSLVFSYGDQGNIVDYNLPRLGERMVNDLWGIATDINGVILSVHQSDSASQSTYGEMEDVAAYSDVKTQGTLRERVNVELPLLSVPDETNAIVYLNETGYPLGQYDIGDLITIKVKNKGVNFNSKRRIVGITVIVNGTGREEIALQTNVPQPWQHP